MLVYQRVYLTSQDPLTKCFHSRTLAPSAHPLRCDPSALVDSKVSSSFRIRLEASPSMSGWMLKNCWNMGDVNEENMGKFKICRDIFDVDVMGLSWRHIIIYIWHYIMCFFRWGWNEIDGIDANAPSIFHPFQPAEVVSSVSLSWSPGCLWSATGIQPLNLRISIGK